MAVKILLDMFHCVSSSHFSVLNTKFGALGWKCFSLKRQIWKGTHIMSLSCSTVFLLFFFKLYCIYKIALIRLWSVNMLLGSRCMGLTYRLLSDASFDAVFDLCGKLQTLSVFVTSEDRRFLCYQPAASFLFTLSFASASVRFYERMSLLHKRSGCRDHIC